MFGTIVPVCCCKKTCASLLLGCQSGHIAVVFFPTQIAWPTITSVVS